MNKKWIIGIVVVAAIGVLVYLSTNTNLFTGRLLPASMNINPTTCKNLKYYYTSNTLITGFVPPNLAQAVECSKKYPDIWNVPLSGEIICQTLKQWQKDASLEKSKSKKYNANLKTAEQCAKDYPNI